VQINDDDDDNNLFSVVSFNLLLKTRSLMKRNTPLQLVEFVEKAY